MKRNPIHLIGITLLGGLLGLPIVVGSKQIVEVRAEDSNSVTFSDFGNEGSSNGGSGSSISYTSNDVTISTNGGYSTNGVLRIYGNSSKSLTITSKNYKIGSIDFIMDESESKKYYDSAIEEGINNVNSTSWKYSPTKQIRFKSITVTFTTSDSTVTSIAVDSDSAPKSIQVGSAISYDGVKINATMSDEETYNVAGKCEFSPAEGTVLSEVGPQVVTVTYKAENSPTTTSGEDLTTTFNVSVTQGEKPTVYTKATSISAGDKIIFVNDGAAKAAKSTLTSSDTAYKHYLDTTSVSVSNDKVNVLSTDEVGVYTVESGTISNTFAFKNASGKYLSLYSVERDGLKFVDSKDAASSWTVNLSSTINRIKSNIAGQKTDSTVYLKYNVNTFRGYKSSSFVGETSIYKYSSGAEKISVQQTASVIEGSSISLKSEATGFKPSSYLWSVGNSEVVSIEGSATGSSVTIKGLKAGSTTVSVKADNSDDLVATCVVTVIAKKDAIIENGEYFITDFAGSHVLSTNLDDISTPDYTDSSSMWTITNNGLDGDTYTISNGSKYLIHNPSIKNSSLDLTSDSSTYWNVTKNDDDSFTFEYSETGNTLSCKPEASSGTWFAFNGATGTQDHIKLMKVGEFTGFEVEKSPTKKEYFAGEEFNKTNSKINALFDNGAKVDVTDLIIWDKLVGGTKAYGKVTIGGVERTVEVPDLTIYAPVQGGFTVTGLQNKYYVGEKFSNSIENVTLTYKFNETTKDRILTKDMYVVEPDVLLSDTTSVRISLVDDSSIYKDYNVLIQSNKMLATGGIKVGDIVSFGTLGYDAYELKGGVELTYDEDSFKATEFGYLPLGNTRFEVGKVGSNYTFKEVNTGFYLRGENKALELYSGINEHSASKDNDGTNSFNLNVNIAGGTKYINMYTYANPDFDEYHAFICYEKVSDDYMQVIMGYSELADNKLVFEYYDYNKDYEVPVETVEVQLAYWRVENGVFVYSLQGDVSEIPEECLFTCSYTVDLDGFECWDVSSVAHPEKTIQYNKQGDKIGMYDYDSYESIMLFRDDSISSGIQSLSVSFYDGMDVIGKGEPFPWTSALIVKANYGGGVVKQIPVGGYDVALPDTSIIGTAKGSVTVDGITKEFTISVIGHTQGFDVVCKDPILVGETYQAHFENHYVPPVDEPIQWSTSDPTLASIDQDGNVTGLAPGYVDVIATSYDGTISDFEHIRIYQQVESVMLNKHEVTIKAGETSQLIATVLPSNASNTNVIYSTEDKSIAFVDKNGLITGVAPGTVTITCEAENHDEENYDTCVVTVEAAPIVHVTDIELDCTYKELEVNDTFVLNAVITPSNATVKNVTWTSSNEDVATVDTNGKVKASAKGDCVITATTADGSFTAACTIKVKTSVDPIHVTSVTLNKSSVAIKPGESFELIATVMPGNADTKQVEFTTLDGNIIEIHQYAPGKAIVEGLENGTAVITATCDGKSATCKVFVTTEPVPEITLVSLEVGGYTTEITQGETYIFDGVVYGLYSDGYRKVIDSYQISSLDTSTAGEKTLTVSVGKISVSFNIKVNEKLDDPAHDVLSNGEKVAIGVGSVVGVSGLCVGLYFLLKKLTVFKI